MTRFLILYLEQITRSPRDEIRLPKGSLKSINVKMRQFFFLQGFTSYHMWGMQAPWPLALEFKNWRKHETLTQKMYSIFVLITSYFKEFQRNFYGTNKYILFSLKIFSLMKYEIIPIWIHFWINEDNLGLFFNLYLIVTLN